METNLTLLDGDGLHGILLGILKDIDSYCLENSITYTISGGTLLGAVRHKGFIPWDEDADIAMPREDFERFKAGYGNERYSIVHQDSQSGILGLHLKVQDKKTLINEGCIKGKYGIFVDVFPLDGMPSDEAECKDFMRKANKARRRLMLSQRPMFHFGDKMHDPIFAKLEAKIHGTRYWYDLCDRLCRKYPFKGSEFVGAVCGVYGYKEVFPRRIYDNLTRMQFEGISLNAISDYDYFLTRFYGNYMTPPPPRKRNGTHGIEAYLID